MPNAPATPPRSVRILRRFFSQRLQTLPRVGEFSLGHAQAVRYLTEQTLARAALRSAVQAPMDAADSASDWKTSLMTAALTELHAHE